MMYIINNDTCLPLLVIQVSPPKQV